jgi:hypothetical protein
VDSVIHWVVNDDIEAIIEASKHFKYHEPTGTTPFNRISHLPESKRHLKMAIKERMRLLAGAYISLASFIDDDLVDFLENADEGSDKEKIKKIYTSVIEDMERLRTEIEAFKLIEQPKS